ncbi:MAG: DegT/DnrJ/EryC1/StrS aminotransferase family protein, partial [Rhodobacterales bacterium]|nr:DegT/DnrJ/EryC1/StrS aminotransferase family protein [Rhodobacterales bacterium]
MRMKRSHGLAREASPDTFKTLCEQNPHLNPTFLFATEGFNLRNHEVCAVLGLSQIKRLDKNIRIRKKNFKYWYDRVENNDKFLIPEYQEGNSSFS